MLAYTVSGSIYEIDLKNRQARRLTGAQPATPRTGPDGAWRRFVGILPLNIGQRIFFEWDPLALPLGTEAAGDMRPATMTTPVCQLAGTPEELLEAGKGVDTDEPSPWDLFPNALLAIIAHSVYGSKKHNPGEPVHWAFGKSTAHVEKAVGHLQRAGQVDPETGALHEVNAAWRAVAALETALIRAGAIPGKRVRGAP